MHENASNKVFPARRIVWFVLSIGLLASLGSCGGSEDRERESHSERQATDRVQADYPAANYRQFKGLNNFNEYEAIVDNFFKLHLNADVIEYTYLSPDNGIFSSITVLVDKSTCEGLLFKTQTETGFSLRIDVNELTDVCSSSCADALETRRQSAIEEIKSLKTSAPHSYASIHIRLGRNGAFDERFETTVISGTQQIRDLEKLSDLCGAN